MNNLFFKSPETYKKLIQSIELLLGEQRHQRGDLATIKRQLHSLITDMYLAKQAEDYLDRDQTTITEEGFIHKTEDEQ